MHSSTAEPSQGLSVLISSAIRAPDEKLSFIFAARRMKNRYGQKRCALLAALEFKSQVHPSFDNNVNKLSRGHGTEGEPSSALTGKGSPEKTCRTRSWAGSCSSRIATSPMLWSETKSPIFLSIQPSRGLRSRSTMTGVKSGLWRRSLT